MIRCHFARFVHCCSAVALAGLLTCAHAVELGEPAVRSYSGQPLVADIELSGFAGDGQPVQVRLAHPDVYRGANIRMHPVLPNLTMSVMRRDRRQFLHITSIKPVETEHVHLFFDLAEGGRHTVRGATLWLSPDPTPAPAPSLPPAAAPAPAPAPAAVPAPEAVPAEPAPHVLAPMPLRAHRSASPAACPQKYTDEQIKTCTSLDDKNGVLTAQIVELEEKVKRLQQAIQATPQPDPPIPMVAAQPAAATPAAPTLAATRPAPVPAKPAEASFPWLLVGAVIAVLLAAGGLFAWRLKAAKGKSAESNAASNGRMVALLERLRHALGRKREGEPEPHAEPTA